MPFKFKFCGRLLLTKAKVNSSQKSEIRGRAGGTQVNSSQKSESPIEVKNYFNCKESFKFVTGVAMLELLRH